MKKKRILFSVVCVLMIAVLVIMPAVTVLVYESVFGVRYTTAKWIENSIEDYPDMKMERSDFMSGGVALAGYKYSSGTDAKGVVVMAHGLGGGGHNAYMSFAYSFTQSGYYVFAYDVCGNDNSEGGSVQGLPRGIMDLDNAICHVKTVEEYKGLPIVLFGHSWGAYSAGSVLNIHPEVSAAVLVAGFDRSEDLILYQGKQMVGPFAYLLLPYVSVYERIKFGGKYTDITATAGMEKCGSVTVVHSKDDNTVPAEYGYCKFFERFEGTEGFDFILYENSGHEMLLYSEEALEYRKLLNEEYHTYVENNGGEYSVEMREQFAELYLNNALYFQPSPELMARIIGTYDKFCGK